MPTYRVAIFGSNILVRSNGTGEKKLLQAEIDVEAADHGEAEATALKQLQEHPSYRGVVMEDPDESPEFQVTNVWRIEPEESFPFTGPVWRAAESYHRFEIGCAILLIVCGLIGIAAGVEAGWGWGRGSRVWTDAWQWRLTFNIWIILGVVTLFYVLRSRRGIQRLRKRKRRHGASRT